MSKLQTGNKQSRVEPLQNMCPWCEMEGQQVVTNWPGWLYESTCIWRGNNLKSEAFGKPKTRPSGETHTLRCYWISNPLSPWYNLGWLGVKYHSHDCQYCDVTSLTAKKSAISAGNWRRVGPKEFEVFETTRGFDSSVKPALKRYWRI